MTSKKEVRVDLAAATPALVCPVCGGYFRDAVTVGECLHTFCRGCFDRKTHVRERVMGRPFCPKCHARFSTTLADQVALPDVVKQRILDKLMPRWQERDAGAAGGQVEAPADEAVGTKRRATTVSQPNRFLKRLRREKEVKLDMLRESMEYRRQPRHLEIFVELRPRGPELRELARPVIRIPVGVTVHVLRKYVAAKLGIGDYQTLDFRCGEVGTAPDHSVEFLRKTMWAESSHLILTYGLQVPAVPEQSASSRAAGLS